VGLERQHNPKLQVDSEEDFVDNIARMLERPPYFRRMERLNIEGPPLLGALPAPTPLSPGDFAAQAKDGLVLDTRMELGFGAAHVPEALSIWKGGLASFAGWFLPYDKPLLLVNEREDPTDIVRLLVRLGYDDIAGTLSGGMLAWHMAGRKSVSTATVTTHELCERLDEDFEAWILDVRSHEELESEGRIADAHHIHITQVPERLNEIPRDRPIRIFCGSGLRSMIAASLLQREGWKDISVILGGLAGWHSTSCPAEF
jgi:hydroxyacylglutathione hydrolase